MRTIKQAQQEGLRTKEQWITSYGRCPKVQAQGELIKGRVFFAFGETEQVFCRAEGKRNGLKLNQDAEPVHQVYYRRARNYYDLYRASDLSQAKRKKIHPPALVDLLCAIFTVNRSAKRYRDAASTQYGNAFHSLSRAASNKKKWLYFLKDAGIREACRRGLLRPEAIHSGLAVYRGGGFCFHSAQVPLELKDKLPKEADAEVFFRESVPRSSAEAKLKDAEFTLLKCDGTTDGFVPLEVPRIPTLPPHTSYLNRESVDVLDEEDDDLDDFDLGYSDVGVSQQRD